MPNGKFKIIHWYSMNCDRKDDWQVGRFTCVPVGLAHWGDSPTEIQNSFLRGFGFKEDGLTMRENKDRPIYLLGNFGNLAHPVREKTFQFFTNSQEFKGLFVSKRAEGLRDMFENFYWKAKFVVSPRGYGLDCYRHHESIFFGAIPIMIHSSLDVLFEDLPVLIVNQYESLNVSFLDQEYKRIWSRTDYKYEKMYVGYWNALIRDRINDYFNGTI
eukprot:TRINITY_DN5171_c0_g1_i2.p1 TRINITY_DN5171_c0_g1~~TRINITY_DN5171_c0_g1_i2.p1  ORF type:complete len:215 (-),score=37.81 TRINITY_DN5171_c0_g1_i2:73-717(-)